jgi:hypothetical protein
MTLLLTLIVWAAIFIGAAFLFKGNPAKAWIESAIFTVGVALWIWLSRAPNRRRG